MTDQAPPRWPGDTRPDYLPGNVAALEHGARSPRVLRPLAEELARQVVDVAPWCGRPAFAAELQAWSWAEAECAVRRAWIDEHGLDSDEARAMGDMLSRAEGRAARLRANLGLSPMGYARLFATLMGATGAGQDGDDTLERLKAEGREILEGRTP